jgi:hypothetical protein
MRIAIPGKADLLRFFAPLLISAAGIGTLVAVLYHDLPGFLAAMFVR